MADKKKIVFEGEVYINHPVPSSLKKIMNEHGYRIIDAIHAPEGVKTYDAQELLDAANTQINGEKVDTSLKGLAQRMADETALSTVTMFGDTQLNLLRDLVTAGKFLRVNKFDVAKQELYGFEDEAGVVLDGYFDNEQQATEVLADTVGEYGSDDTLAKYGMLPKEQSQQQPIPGDPGVGTGTGAPPPPASGASGPGTGNTETNTVEVPADWKDGEWHEKIALAKKLTKLDKIEGADGKTATQVAEEHIQAYLDGKK